MNFKHLISNDGTSVSTGRVLLWLFVGFSVYFWFWRDANAFPPTLAQSLFVVLTYNLGSKIVTAYQDKNSSTYMDSREPVPMVDVDINKQEKTPQKKKEYTSEDK